MAKAASATVKGASSSKKTTTSKSRTRVAQSGDLVVPPLAVAETGAVTAVLQRLDTLEEKITAGFAGLAEELRALKTAAVPAAMEEGVPSESPLPLMGDVLRHNLMEHLTPVLAALKRLEERIGFVANRLKHGGSGGGGGGQDRPKPWRHEQGRHPRPPRPQQNGQQRPSQGQPPQWAPPSAASVQGHFARRPLPGGGVAEEED